MLICEKCGCTMRCMEVGVVAVEYYKRTPKPYKAWATDRYGCTNCGHTVLLIGKDQKPLAHDFQTKEMEKYEKQAQAKFV